MDTLNFDLLLRILVAHLLADFVLQPSFWVEQRESLGLKSRYFWLHIAINLVALIVTLWDWHLWPIVFWVISGHILLDALKSRFSKTSIWIFLADQLLHLVIIVIVWLAYSDQIQLFYSTCTALLNNQKLWWLILMFILLTSPSSILIGKLTQNWSNELEATGLYKGLENAGKWIGTMERLLIFTFIVIDEFSAIGFLIAAKSIFRFGDLKNALDHKKTEYIIIGTFLSFSIAIAIGLFYKLVIKGI